MAKKHILTEDDFLLEATLDRCRKHTEEDREYASSSFRIENRRKDTWEGHYGKLKNISKIQENHVYFVPELCYITGERINVEDTKARDRFKKKLALFFEFKDMHRKGIRIIKRKRDMNVKMPEKSRSKNPYIDPIYNILTLFLYENKKTDKDFYTSTIQSWEIYETFGFCNSDFYNKDKMNKERDSDNKTFDGIMLSVKNYFRNNIKTVLRAIHINYGVEWCIVTKVRLDYGWRTASKTESSAIFKMEKEALKALEADSYFYIIKRKQQEDYKKEVLKRFREKCPEEDYLNYYSDISFWAPKENIDKNKEKLFKENNITKENAIKEITAVLMKNITFVNSLVLDYFKDYQVTDEETFVKKDRVKGQLFATKAVHEAQKDKYISNYVQITQENFKDLLSAIKDSSGHHTFNFFFNGSQNNVAETMQVIYNGDQPSPTIKQE